MASNNNSERKVFTITWIIENIKYSTQNEGEVLTSPSFIIYTMMRTKWSLFLYPCFHKGTLEDGFLLGLRRMPDCKGPHRIKIDCECALLTADGCVDGPYNVTERLVSQNDEVLFPRFKKTYGISAVECSFIPNGNLTFRCKMSKCFGEINNDGYWTARTHIGVKKKSSIWSIRNFSSLGKGTELTYRIKSTLNDKSIVTLKFTVTGDDETLQVSFISSDSEIESRCFSINLSVLDSNGNTVTCGEAKVLFVKKPLGKESKCLLSLAKKEIMRNKSQYLRDDVLSLLYQCNFSSGLIYEAIENTNYGWIPPQIANAGLTDLKLAENTATKNPSAPSVLKRDIELMLHENVLCDVKLRTGAETFPAHWFILSARSPVFRAMFQSDMKEKAQDCIHIEDVDADTVRRLLLYMYTDACEDLQRESASQLYAAADKYQILGLKDECSSFLKANLDTANACEALMIADLHHDEHLKSATSDFILKHDKEIFNSDEWKRLMETNGKLAFGIMLLKYKD